MFYHMVTIYIAEVVVLNLQYQKWYFIGVIQTPEVTGPVNQNLVTRPITIQGAYIPPLLGHTEHLCEVLQPKRGIIDGILIVSGVSITLAFG